MSLIPAKKIPTPRKRRGPDKEPWVPFDLRKLDVYALKALQAGNANEGQQKRVFEVLLDMSGMRDLEFRPDDRASAFAGGKRFVGLQIVKAVTLPAAIVDKMD